jgi:ATP-dependent DNA helicase RecG
VIEAVGRALAAGDRVFWVCPRVEKSERSDLAAATERFSALRSKFGPMVDLVHGKMKPADKGTAMKRFAAGETRLLVASTVIEVGIDVPEATVMVVEHADQFGLATLHQLRGRVGRGKAQAYCLLLHDARDDDDTARACLAIMRETDDGFRIAEEDMRLRGAGDLSGTRQSGKGGFRIADVVAHAALLKAASEDARGVIAAGPDLTGPREAGLARSSSSVHGAAGKRGMKPKENAARAR